MFLSVFGAVEQHKRILPECWPWDAAATRAAITAAFRRSRLLYPITLII